MKADRVSGALFVAFVVAVQLPFALLSANFGYPDILRQPAAYVLHAFAEGGTFGVPVLAHAAAAA